MENYFEKISVIGLGYIGLPTAAMFASRKIEVVGVDVDEAAVETINLGETHIVEPGLNMIVRAAVSEGYLRATITPEPADAFLIAVPTPFKGENHEPDLSYVEAACRAIAPVLENGNLVILESTSPVGTTEVLAGWLATARPDLSFPQDVGEASDIRIAHCPERVLPGKVMQELLTNDRIIGGMTSRCSELAASLYKTFVTGECFLTSEPCVAEMAKLAENSFRDVNIAFANELSLICDRLNIDVWELISLSNRHPRVNILQPGAGVGGHCIAVDPWFIVSSCPDMSNLIKTARQVNDAKPDWVVQKVREAVRDFLSQNPSRKQKPIKVACYGLAFKPDIDDLRESPALNIARKCANIPDVELLVVEPNIVEMPEIGPKVVLVPFEHALAEADVHVYLVKHRQFLEESKASGFVLDLVGL